MIEKEFLQKKGSLDLLFELEKSPKSFTDLLKCLRLSPNTISNRLDEARKLGLIKEDLFRNQKNKIRIRYTLSKNGEEVLKRFQTIRDQYLKIHEEISYLEAQLKEKEQKLKRLLERW